VLTEYYFGDKIKENFECVIKIREMGNAYRIVVGRPEGKRLLDRPRR
jgi:hypothetical protein